MICDPEMLVAPPPGAVIDSVNPFRKPDPFTVRFCAAGLAEGVAGDMPVMDGEDAAQLTRQSVGPPGGTITAVTTLKENAFELPPSGF